MDELLRESAQRAMDESKATVSKTVVEKEKSSENIPINLNEMAHSKNKNSNQQITDEKNTNVLPFAKLSP